MNISVKDIFENSTVVSRWLASVSAGNQCNKNTHGNYLCLADCQSLLRTQQEYVEHLWNYTLMR